MVPITEKIKPGDIITDQFGKLTIFHPSSMTYVDPFCVRLLISHENVLFSFIRCFQLVYSYLFLRKTLKLTVNIAAATRSVDKSHVLDRLR